MLTAAQILEQAAEQTAESMRAHQRRVDRVARRGAEISVLAMAPWVRTQDELIGLIRGEDEVGDINNSGTDQPE